MILPPKFVLFRIQNFRRLDVVSHRIIFSLLSLLLFRRDGQFPHNMNFENLRMQRHPQLQTQELGVEVGHHFGSRKIPPRAGISDDRTTVPTIGHGRRSSFDPIHVPRRETDPRDRARSWSSLSLPRRRDDETHDRFRKPRTPHRALSRRGLTERPSPWFTLTLPRARVSREMCTRVCAGVCTIHVRVPHRTCAYRVTLDKGEKSYRID